MIRQALYELALDLRRSSAAVADELWSHVAPALWESTRNPWLIWHTLSDARVEVLRTDRGFIELLQHHLADRRKSLEAPGWFPLTHPEGELRSVAYFSMEFGLSEALPIYSGGLGILAGDHMKAASDLDIPLVGIGLLYQEGYFRQAFDSQGEQVEFFPHNDPIQLPIERVTNEKGDPLRIELGFPGRTVWLRVWKVTVGRLPLYLLDSNDLFNTPADRGITSQLYGGGSEVRLQQEIALGIGGFRLLRELNREVQICHLNEGHAAFAVLERARMEMQRHGFTFERALEATKPGNLFTTHTPVPAGFDRYDPELIVKYFKHYADHLGIGVDGILALGREKEGEALNMAYLAVRSCGVVNGVSRLHGEVTRKLFANISGDAPIGYVTNGIHLPSWESPEADALWNDVCGCERWKTPTDERECHFDELADERLWEFINEGRKHLIAYARTRLARQLEIAGYEQKYIKEARQIFDPTRLTLGFARRFTGYKRPNLLLHDSERLIRMLKDPERPVQLILAGKAHPGDHQGKMMIKQWNNFIYEHELFSHVIFLSDYDIFLAERLVQGIDVWVNTPRRPSEASGTSGMKVLANGGLNLSILDGWWAEAYQPEFGWGIQGESDEDEAMQLYDILENEVIPLFYAGDIPTGWLARVRESMAELTPRYSTNRMVREYTENYYIPGARALDSVVTA